MNNLSQIKVVLFRTSHPGNIGSVARAMKTMGLSQLVLVDPACDPSDPRARALASGAGDVLDAARIYADLPSAIADCVWVLGTSARHRRLAWSLSAPREAMSVACQRAAHGKVAVLFGPEQSGLDNEALDLCHQHVFIPANPEYSSLNLAQAVQIICYELRQAADIPVEAFEHERALATREALVGFFEHGFRVLYRVGFLARPQRIRLERRLLRLFQRLVLGVEEVDILRGILTAIEKKLPKDTES